MKAIAIIAIVCLLCGCRTVHDPVVIKKLPQVEYNEK